MSEKNLTDLLKRLLTNNAGAEVLGGLVGAVDKLKNDLGGIVQGEIQKALKRVDWRKEGEKFLETHDINISMRVQFKKRPKT